MSEAKVLAGGQSLMPMLNFRLARIEHLVDINRLGSQWATPTFGPSVVTIPALVRQRQLERSDEAAALAPVLTEALHHVAHPQIRNRGTVCGSLAHADPAAEMPTVLTALDARFTLASARGMRTLPAEEFFLFHLTTALEPDELLLEVSFDRPGPRRFSSFREFATRRGDFALAGVAAVCEVDVEGVVTDCRLVAAGVAPTPRRLTDAEQLLIGQHLLSREVSPGRLGDAEEVGSRQHLLSDLVEAARVQVEPTGDIHASADYRARLTGVLVKRALIDIVEKAHG